MCTVGGDVNWCSHQGKQSPYCLFKNKLTSPGSPYCWWKQALAQLLLCPDYTKGEANAGLGVQRLTQPGAVRGPESPHSCLECSLLARRSSSFPTPRGRDVVTRRRHGSFVLTSHISYLCRPDAVGGRERCICGAGSAVRVSGVGGSCLMSVFHFQARVYL